MLEDHLLTCPISTEFWKKGKNFSIFFLYSGMKQLPGKFVSNLVIQILVSRKHAEIACSGFLGGDGMCEPMVRQGFIIFRHCKLYSKCCLFCRMDFGDLWFMFFCMPFDPWFCFRQPSSVWRVVLCLVHSWVCCTPSLLAIFHPR